MSDPYETAAKETACDMPDDGSHAFTTAYLRERFIPREQVEHTLAGFRAIKSANMVTVDEIVNRLSELLAGPE